MEKENSTNAVNRKKLEEDCGMAYTQSVIGGRWKISILGYLLDSTLRYSQLRDLLPGISEKMLASQLKELVKDGLLQRISHPEVPPRVEYTLTDKGASLRMILMEMSAWGEQHK